MARKKKWGKENGDFKEEAKWIYLAGILDADGYIGISKYTDFRHKSPHYKPVLYVVGDRKLMEWLNENIERRYVRIKHDPFVLEWRVFKKSSVSKILERCIPYMITKKERAVIVKELTDLPLNKHSKERKEELYKRFRAIMDEWHAALQKSSRSLPKNRGSSLSEAEAVARKDKAEETQAQFKA